MQNYFRSTNVLCFLNGFFEFGFCKSGMYNPLQRFGVVVVKGVDLPPPLLRCRTAARIIDPFSIDRLITAVQSILLYIDDQAIFIDFYITDESLWGSANVAVVLLIINSLSTTQRNLHNNQGDTI